MAVAGKAAHLILQPSSRGQVGRLAQGILQQPDGQLGGSSLPGSPLLGSRVQLHQHGRLGDAEALVQLMPHTLPRHVQQQVWRGGQLPCSGRR